MKKEEIIGSPAVTSVCEEVYVYADLLGKIVFLGVEDNKFTEVTECDWGDALERTKERMLVHTVLGWDVDEVQIIVPRGFDNKGLFNITTPLISLGITVHINEETLYSDIFD